MEIAKLGRTSEHPLQNLMPLAIFPRQKMAAVQITCLTCLKKNLVSKRKGYAQKWNLDLVLRLYQKFLSGCRGLTPTIPRRHVKI